MLAAALALLTFAAAALGDFVETRYVQASTSGATPKHAHHAARLSVSLYAVGFLGWVITVKVSLWYSVPEVLGLYVGTYVAMRRRARPA